MRPYRDINVPIYQPPAATPQQTTQFTGEP